MRADYLEPNSGVSQHKMKIRRVAADITLTAEDSGSIILVNPTATTAVTLPTLVNAGAGWYCKIVLTEDTFSTDAGMNQKVNIDFGSGNTINGQTWAADTAAGDVSATGDDFIACTDACTGGDYFDVFTDGSIWYAEGHVQDASECPFAAAAG